MTDRLVLELPMAPTANNHYATIVIAKKPRRIVSSEGKKFRAAVLRYCRSENVPLCRGSLKVQGFLFFQTRAGDIDNRIKPTLDALEYAGVCTNDKQVVHVDFRRVGSREPKPGRMIIVISAAEALLEDSEGNLHIGGFVFK